MIRKEDKLYELLKDYKFHPLDEIAFKIWNTKPDVFLKKNINVTKYRTQQRYNIKIKSYNNRGLKLERYESEQFK